MLTAATNESPESITPSPSSRYNATALVTLANTAPAPSSVMFALPLTSWNSVPEIVAIAPALTPAESSDVLFVGLVAVAVIVSPTATAAVRVAENVAVPAAPIGTLVEPR